MLLCLEWECDADMCIFGGGGRQIHATDLEKPNLRRTRWNRNRKNVPFIVFLLADKVNTTSSRLWVVTIHLPTGAPRLCFKKVWVSKEAKEEIEGESEAINLEARIAEWQGMKLLIEKPKLINWKLTRWTHWVIMEWGEMSLNITMISWHWLVRIAWNEGGWCDATFREWCWRFP